MPAINLNGLQKILHPQRNTENSTERILTNLSHSNLGTRKNEPAATALDTFSITENISELLSPACGMSDDEKQRYLAHIMAKLKSGKKLTSEEMRFLQAEDPILYQQAARVESLRDALETKLKTASSKEEALQIYTDSLSSVSEKDPMKEFIVAAYDNVYKEFQKSDEYKSLPQDEDDSTEEKNKTAEKTA